LGVRRRAAGPARPGGRRAHRASPPPGNRPTRWERSSRSSVASREAFLGLPARTQALLLEYRWEAIRGPWVEPALEALYEGWKGELRFPDAGDAALRRLAELALSRGRALAVEEIRTGAHGLVLEAAAIEYLFEHDKAVAQRRHQPALACDRGQCAAPPWSQLAPRRWDETVEAAALAHLGSRDDHLVIDAARALETYGSARVKEPLLARFAARSAEWRGDAGWAMRAKTKGNPSCCDSSLIVLCSCRANERD
jgi:hypothetical protein